MLLRGFGCLRPESRYRRFLAPMPELTEAMVRYFTEVDHHVKTMACTGPGAMGWLEVAPLVSVVVSVDVPSLPVGLQHGVA